jgi:nucleoside-diphosphate-sugar epimerase
MRILVIGGTQFMGRHAVEKLVDRGHDVTVLHRRDRHDLGAAVRNLQADRGDLDAVERLLGAHNFEAVLDFAYDWAKGTTAAQVEGAARSCTDALERYVFISSIAAYEVGTDLTEDAPLVPDDVPNPYAQHKASTERALFRMHETTHFPVTTFRPPFVHGPRQPFYREQFFWDRMRDGRPIILPDGGDTPMQWAFAPDVAEACVRAIEVSEAEGEAFNVAHAEHTTQRTFVEALGRAAGIEPVFVSIPRNAILAAGGDAFAGNLYFGEYLDLPPITTRIDRARRILGFEPTPFEEALAVTRDWYLTQPRRPIDYSFEDRLLALA